MQSWQDAVWPINEALAVAAPLREHLQSFWGNSSFKDLTKSKAQKKADEYRQQLDTPPQLREDTSLNVAGLVEHYTGTELSDASGKAAKVIKAYRYIFNNYILPKWVVSDSQR